MRRLIFMKRSTQWFNLPSQEKAGCGVMKMNDLGERRNNIRSTSHSEQYILDMRIPALQ